MTFNIFLFCSLSLFPHLYSFFVGLKYFKVNPMWHVISPVTISVVTAEPLTITKHMHHVQSLYSDLSDIFSSNFFYCDKIYIKFTILTNLQCTVQWH